MKENFKERLEKLVQESGGSVAGFAKAVGIQRQTITNYLLGVRMPTADMLLQIVQETKTSADWLLGISDKRIPNRDFQDACETLGITERTGQFIYKMAHGDDLDRQALEVLVGYDADYHQIFLDRMKDYLDITNYTLSPKDSGKKSADPLPPHCYEHSGTLSVVNTTELCDYLLFLATETFREQLRHFPYKDLDPHEVNITDIPFDNDKEM